MEEIFHKLDWVLPLRNDYLTPVAEFFTALGYAPFFLFLLPILYWAWDKQATTRITIVLVLSTLLNLFLKDLFQDPRPEEYFMEGQGEDSFGLPSGHTQLAIIFWYSLAMEIGKRWFWVVATILVAGIASSRLYLGVHDLEDVIGGAILGFAGLLLYGGFLRLRHRVLVSKIVVSAGLMVAMVPLFFWPNQIPPPDMAIILGGFLLGWLCGVFLERQWCPFEASPVPGKTVLAVILGLAGVAGSVAGLSTGLKKPVDAGWLPEIVALLLGGWVAGMMIAFVAPCVLIKAGLMARTGAEPSER